MKGFTSKFEKHLIGVASTAVLILIWKLVSLRIGTDIILPAPETVLLRLEALVTGLDFWMAVGATVLRTVYGLALSFVLGFSAGIASGVSRRVDAMLSPLVSVTRTVPVMSLILLAMIWFKTDLVPVFVCVLMIFPILTANVKQGVAGVDRKLIEFSVVYKLSRREALREIIIPSVVPFVLGGLRSSIGVGWKVVIAAEVLAQPVRAIGTGLQFSQMNLETAEVLGWTVMAVVLSWLSEGILDVIIKRIRPEASVNA
ncbi:MAG: ABC transporter permease subunit [Spirochaetales bacterium]|uniref:ABC transporter permease subunit n=1 Tax=Candidatus Thalassospirochaeta sargassi TaxID=3119039 RepID=A0AAJ1IJN2_9SPIO|nr:ABC transporter permease subunit [Spirochaetales bacterium]